MEPSKQATPMTNVASKTARRFFGRLVCLWRGWCGTRQPIYLEPYCAMCGEYLGSGYTPIHSDYCETRASEGKAIPWTEKVSEPSAVIAIITKTFVARIITDSDGDFTEKNHGRRAYLLSIGFGECAVDLSFMPSHPPGPVEFVEASKSPRE